MIPNSSSGLLVTDLDGTLAVDGRIGSRERKAAEGLRSLGIPILVITGRNLKSLGRVEGVWDVADEVMFSSGAGLWEDCHSAPIERSRLSATDVRDIGAILDHEGEDYCVLHRVPDNHRFHWRRHRDPAANPDFDARMTIYGEWGFPIGLDSRDDLPEQGACQVLVIRPEGTGFPSRLQNQLASWSVFHGSSPLDHRSVWVEIFPKGLDKGQALRRRCNEKNIPQNRVLALGNDHNDASMLAWASHGRVVEGAPGELSSRFKVLPPAGSGGFEAAAREAEALFT